MATHEIPQADWEKYLATFTERHKGAKVTIEDVDPLTDPKVEAGDMSFVSITYKPDSGDESVVELVTTSGGSAEKTHAISAPKAIFHKPGAGVLSSEVNPDEVLEITSGGKPPIHLLTFRHP